MFQQHFVWHLESELPQAPPYLLELLARDAVHQHQPLPWLLHLAALSVGPLGSWLGHLAVEGGEIGMLCMCTGLLNSLGVA